MLSLLNYSQLMSQMSAAVQGAATAISNLAPGSLVRALLQAYASTALWLQWLIVLVLAKTRAATSNGADLDSWMADFTFPRLGGTAANGTVTFARFTATSSAVVPVGATVITGDGTQTFEVYENDANAFWVSGGGYYLIPAGTSAAAIPVQCENVGTGGNVLANTISLLGQAIPGVDTVNNPAAFVNGVAQETDAAFRARFGVYFPTLARGTLAAVESAIAGVEAGLTYDVATNVNSAGASQPGNFVAYVDDGTGSPSSGLLSSVYTAIDAVRPICVSFATLGPVVTGVATTLTLVVPSGYTHSTVATAVQTAVAAYIDGLAVGSACTYSGVNLAINGAVPSGSTISALLINGATADIAVPANGAARSTSVTVS